MLSLDEIYCGDCITLMKKIDNKSIDMVLCDLPYGVTSRNKWDVIIPFSALWEHYERIIKDDGAIVLTAIQPFSSMLVMSNIKLFKYEWVWEKQQGTGFLNAKRQPLRNHESVLVFYKTQPIYNPQFTSGKPYVCKSGSGSTNYREQVSVITENKGVRYPLTVQKFAYDGKKEHPTQKPLALFEYLISTYTNHNDLVLDNCVGSGTTALACKKLNRRFIGMDVNKMYVDITNRKLGEVVG